MKRLLAGPCVAAAIAATLLLGSTAPAHAARSAAAAVVTGNGTITPGLTTKAAFQHFTFTSAVIDTVGMVNGAVSTLGASHCTASGGSAMAETVAAGRGTGTWSCSTGPLAGRYGTLTYVRAGAAVAVTLAGRLTGVLACAFIPSPVTQQPVRNYSLDCAGAGAALN
jgi:hypothetical protein